MESFIVQIFVVLWIFYVVKGKDFARNAPFCVDTVAVDFDLVHFKNIFNHEIHTTNEPILVADANGKSKKGFVDKLEFHKLNTPEPSIPYLNQWFHMTIKTPVDYGLQGIYIQSISGPLGLPFGQFRADFTCTEDIDKMQEVNAIIVPCKYRPRTNVRHPHIFAVSGNELREEFHVHFNWIDIMCIDAPVMQFLIVAVRNFETLDFETFFSPVYDNTDIDSSDGIPYPYYIGWKNNMMCHQNASPMKGLQLSQTITEKGGVKIRYNADFDECIFMNTGIENGKLCPPGPLKCTRALKYQWPTPGDYTTKLERSKDIKQSVFDFDCTVQCSQITNNNSNKFLDKKPVSVKPTATSPDSTVSEEPKVFQYPKKGNTIELQGKEFMKNSEHIFVWDTKRYHGLILIFVWSCATTASNFLARFYKEDQPKESNAVCGMNCWLLGHITISFISATLMWLGVIAVLHNHGEKLENFDCSKINIISISKHNAKDTCEETHLIGWHKFLGWIAILTFHVELICGWVRPRQIQQRMVYLFFHALAGHFAQFVAIGAVFASNACAEILWEVGILEVVSLCMVLLGEVTQNMEDTELKLIPPRKHCPILDVFEFRKDSSCRTLRSILLVLHGTIHLIIFTLVVVSYKEMYREHSTAGYNETVISLTGLFSECKILGISARLKF